MPDGQRIAFTHLQSIWLHDLVTGQERRLVLESSSPEARLDQAIISPDGNFIAYARTVGMAGEHIELFVVDVKTSIVRRLASGYRKVKPSAWSADGKQIIAEVWDRGRPDIGLVSVAAGSGRMIGEGESPRFSADAQYISFVKGGASGAGDSEIHVWSERQGIALALVRNFGSIKSPVWSADGRHVVFLSNHGGTSDLWSITVVDGRAVGSPELLRENVDSLLDASGNGDIYYQSGTLSRDLYVRAIHPPTGKLGAPPDRITSHGVNGGAAWSPDGDFLAYYRGSVATSPVALIIRSTKTGKEHEIAPKTPLQVASWQPQWFPDSRSLLIHSPDGALHRLDIRTGQYKPALDTVRIPPDSNAGAPRRYSATVILAPDGRAIYYLARDPVTRQPRILHREMSGGKENELCRLQVDGVRDLAVSRDGRQLVFLTYLLGNDRLNKRRRYTIMTLPTTGGDPRALYTSPEPLPLRYPVWARNGRGLFFVAGVPRCEMFSIPVEGGEPQALGVGLHDLYFINLHPDGKQIVFADEQWNNQLWVLKNLFPVSSRDR